MPRSRGPRNVIKRLGQTHQLVRMTSEQRDGETVWSPGDPEDIHASVRPGETADFSIGVVGQEDSSQLVVDTIERGDRTEQQALDDPYTVEPPIEEDDRLLYDGQAWRCVQRQYANRNGFSRFVLQRDGRGGGEPGDGTDGSDGGNDDPPWTIQNS